VLPPIAVFFEKLFEKSYKIELPKWDDSYYQDDMTPTTPEQKNAVVKAEKDLVDSWFSDSSHIQVKTDSGFIKVDSTDMYPALREYKADQIMDILQDSGWHGMINYIQSSK
jgi:hypothetical protein